jgi:hypothetical protein
MMLADALSRLCAPSEGFYEVTLPAKIHTLLENLPPQVAECRAIRASANKDTAAVALCRDGGNPPIRLVKGNLAHLWNQRLNVKQKRKPSPSA